MEERVNMGKYLPKKGKVCKNKECHKAQVIFDYLSLFRQIFPAYKPQADELNYIFYFIPSGRLSRNISWLQPLKIPIFIFLLFN